MNGDESELARSGVREAVRHVGRADDDVALRNDHSLLTELECRHARLDNEDLGVGVAMQLRSDARLCVHEDHRERHVAVLRADEFVAVWCRVELVERNDEWVVWLLRGHERILGTGTIIQLAVTDL
jgi:hypothetical protein